MANHECVEWQFSGSDAAEEAAAASLGTYTSELFALCDPQGKPILPPRNASPESSNTAEKAVVKAVICGNGNAYAPSIGLPIAKDAVAEYLNRDLDNKLTGDDVFMTVGCKQAIEVVVDILAKPNANILIPRPGFPADYVRSLFKKVEVRRYEVIPEKEFEIDLDSVKQMADKNTFAIFIINPHNPNGNYYTEAHLEQAAIPTILEKTPQEFFDRRQSFLKEKVDIAYSKLKEIPTLTCYMKPEACTFLWTELDPSHFVDIKDDQDFCNKLAKEENLVVLPGIAFGQKNWLRHSIDMETPALEDAFTRLKSFCERHTEA